MQKILLNAQERTILGKKVKKLRKEGLIPGHVFGNKIETEHVSVNGLEFIKVLNRAGETGLIDLKIGEDKIRPVLIREVAYDPRTEDILNIDFYQVNLKEKVIVPVPLVLTGEETELVHLGEAVVLQNLSEVEIEAFPTDLVENIAVDITSLKAIDDAITVADLNYDREKLTILAEAEEVVVKLAPAITEEMKRLMEEQEAEAAATQEAVETAEGEQQAPAVEGEESKQPTEGREEQSEAGEAGAAESSEQPKEK